MAAPDPESSSQEETFQLLALFARTDDGLQRQAQYEPCMAAYGCAVMAGQLLEFAIKLAAPSITSPVADESQAHKDVESGLDRTFNNAIEELTRLLPGSSREVDAELTGRLHAARRRRNRLAHDWVFDGPLRIARGDGETVRAELEHDAELFAGLTEELFTLLFTPAVAERGIALSDLMAAADVVGFHLAIDPALPTAGLPEDGLQLFTEVLAAIDADDPCN